MVGICVTLSPLEVPKQLPPSQLITVDKGKVSQGLGLAETLGRWVYVAKKSAGSWMHPGTQCFLPTLGQR